MGKDKLWRFSEIKRFPNVTEAPFSETFAQKGKWKEEIFKNNKPIVLELGCGKGEYMLDWVKCFQKKLFRYRYQRKQNVYKKEALKKKWIMCNFYGLELTL